METNRLVLLPLLLLSSIIPHGPIRGEEAAQPSQTVRLRLVGISPLCRRMPLSEIPVQSYFFAEDDAVRKATDTPVRFKLGWHKSVYPGIDLASFGDGYQFEYVFIVSPGSDPSLILSTFDVPDKPLVTREGNVYLELFNGTVIQNSAPVVFLKKGDSKQKIEGGYNRLVYRKTIGLSPGADFDAQVNNEEFRRFLNDAQTNTANPRGNNMFFDEDGNVWFNRKMKKGRDELFTIAASRLVYTPGKKPGQRYGHRILEKFTPFADRPVAGVSWRGAAKYCNWLTIESGRGVPRRVYREGQAPDDWSPAPRNKWALGFFLAHAAAKSKGFRAVTPFPPDKTFLFHILYGFYMKPTPIETVEEEIAAGEEPTVAQIPEEGTTLPELDIELLIPDGVLYKPTTPVPFIPGPLPKPAVSPSGI